MDIVTPKPSPQQRYAMSAIPKPCTQPLGLRMDEGPDDDGDVAAAPDEEIYDDGGPDDVVDDEGDDRLDEEGNCLPRSLGDSEAKLR